MRVLVTGASGRLGGRLAACLAERLEVVAGHHDGAVPEGLPIVSLDVRSPASIEAALEASRAQAVVHAAAQADPDACERDPEQAEVLNVRASEAVARACRRHDVRLVAISTDLVFAGDREVWREDDPTGPLMVYGRTKLAGEEATLEEHPSAVVARVALVCGRGHGIHGTSSESIAWTPRAGRRLKLYTDQFRTPVDAASVAAAIAHLIVGTAVGRFHLGGPERVSRAELGLRTARLLGLDARLIETVTKREHPPGAPRPADVSLDSSRAARELGWTPRPLDVALAETRSSPESAG